MNRVKEIHWKNTTALLIIIVTTIPYLLGFLLQGENWRFTGFFFGVEDGNSYIAKMLSGANGAWLFTTPYTAYPQTGVLAFLPYILLGKLSSQPGQHEQLVALFQLFRWAGILLLVYAVYDFCSVFIREKKNLRLTALIALLGGGLGFLVLLGVKWTGYQDLPLEFYSPESFGFLSILGLPHLAAARAFLLWGLAIYLKWNSAQNIWQTAVKIGLMGLLTGLMQPLSVVVGWAVIASGLGVEWIIKAIDEKRIIPKSGYLLTKIKILTLSILISSPIPIYTFIRFSTDPYLQGWQNQNIILSPPPLDYLLAYGVVLPFILFGLIHIIKNNYSKGYLLVGWLLIFPLLAYFPYPLQRRLPEGIWVGLSAMAMYAIEQHGSRLLRRLSPILYISFFSTLVVFSGAISIVSQPSLPVYRTESEVNAFNYLDQISDGDIVLASYDISNALPAWANAKTLIGHGPESINLFEVQAKTESFLQGGMTLSDQISLLESFNVNFVLIDRNLESSIVYNFEMVEEIYSSQNHILYKVIHDKP